MTKLSVSAFCLLLVAFAVVTPSIVSAENISELRILPDGSLSAKAVVVTQKAGPNLFCRVAWGNTFIRLTVLLHNDTAIVKKFGGKATIDDVKEGDMLEVEGVLLDGTGQLVVKAKKVKDLSLVLESKEIAGVVQSNDPTTRTLKTTTKGLGGIKIILSSDALVKKGVRVVGQSEVVVGDKILSAKGVYNHITASLEATSLEIYQDKKIFASRTFEGTVAGISGSSVPAELVLSTQSGKNYTVFVSANTAILSKSKTAVSISRFAPGDKVIVTGSIKETNLGEITATVLRNLAF